MSAYPSFLETEPAPPTLRALVRRVRVEIREATAKGVDWRPVIDSIPTHRGHWRSFAAEDRARFMKYIRPYWGVYRRRLAPDFAAVVERMSATRRIKFHAGQIQVLEAK